MRKRKDLILAVALIFCHLFLFISEAPSQALDLESCVGPLGMETGSIKDTAITASSSFEDSTVGPQNARVRNDRNGGAWCPKDMVEKEGKEWLEINLESVFAISATETQGRFGNGQGVEFAESYMLEYFRPRLNKWVRYRTREGKEVLMGNGNTYMANKNDLNPVILASKIRFHPYSFFKRTICMRVEIYGCSFQGGLIAYSMPQGDKRGKGYVFHDWTYDGEWKGNQLFNGLGCLTDGYYGPKNFKLSYYPEGRGWVGWKQNSERNFVEILFEFDGNREFHHIYIYTNNQFSKDVSVFKAVEVYFGFDGKDFNQDPVESEPMEDSIFEEPRNVTIKLHRRVGKFVKLRLFFATKWIMISEVGFDSTVARGNYSNGAFTINSNVDDGNTIRISESDKEAVLEVDLAGGEGTGNEISSKKQNSSGIGMKGGDEMAFMPIVVGVLVTVIVLLAVIIFFIVSRSKKQRQEDHMSAAPMASNDILNDEKIALNGGAYFSPNFTLHNTSSDTGSSGHSGQLLPKLDDNYNTPHHPMLTPRQIRAQLCNNNRSVQSQLTPQNTRKFLPNAPRLPVPPPPNEPPPIPQEALYTEPHNYSEPYKPGTHYGYGQVSTELDDSTLKQGLLSDTSCDRDYAVPLPRSQHFHMGVVKPAGSTSQRSPHSLHLGASSNRNNSSQRLDVDVDSVSSSMERNGYKDHRSSSATTNSHCSDSLSAMRSRLETHVVPELTGSQLSLRQRLSEGNFGTVYIADAHGLPEYGGHQHLDGEEAPAKRLVAVKFLSKSASNQDKEDFIREVRLLSVLEDVNISRVLGMCSTQDPYLVAMEYLEHGDLNQFLRCHLPEGSNPLPPGTRTLSLGTLIHLASQVASGMRYLESLNFVHRDLATRNCLVGKSYNLKICDFGSDNPLYARDYFEMDSHLLIPLRWMAWESVVMCKYTTKSDVWSFGVCLWEILQLASVRPHVNLGDEELLTELEQAQHSSRLSLKLDKPPICPKDLYELMCECWKKEALNRPSFREIHLFLQRKNLGYSPL